MQNNNNELSIEQLDSFSNHFNLKVVFNRDKSIVSFKKNDARVRQ